jgi:hypothetical protein
MTVTLLFLKANSRIAAITAVTARRNHSLLEFAYPELVMAHFSAVADFLQLPAFPEKLRVLVRGSLPSPKQPLLPNEIPVDR